MTLNLRLFIALLLALILTIIPLPNFLIAFRPAWILLLAFYIQLFLPNYFNVALLFLLGICLDVLLATVLGEHAFTLLLITWLVSGKAQRFSFFPMGQQMILIFLGTFFYQIVILIIDVLMGYHADVIGPIGSALISMLLWPWLKLFADSLLCPKVTYQ